MTDMQTKQVIKYLAAISKNLAGLNTGISELVKETRKQNQLTMAMIQAAEADDDEEGDIDDDLDDLETEDISVVEADDEEKGDIDDDD